jgi:hypothetical protein
MPYRLIISEADCLGVGKFTNASGDTECVEFVRQATGAPGTPIWGQGIKVSKAKLGDIPRGTAIATFDSHGHYPTDHLGKHAAIYLSQDFFSKGKRAIHVLDQWDDQGEVLPRPIYFDRPKGTKRSNDGDTFYVIK